MGENVIHCFSLILDAFKELTRKQVRSIQILETQMCQVVFTWSISTCVREENQSQWANSHSFNSLDYFCEEAHGEFELIVFRPHCNRLVYRQSFPIPEFDSSTGSFTLVKIPILPFDDDGIVPPPDVNVNELNCNSLISGQQDG